MEKYFEIKKNSDLYRDYFHYLDVSQMNRDFYKSFSAKHGIEASTFAMCIDCLWIDATDADVEKFGNALTNKDKYGGRRFKKNSTIGKEYAKLVNGVELASKPIYWDYGVRFYSQFKTRMFDIGDKLYGSMEADTPNLELIPSMIEMKASEFFKIIEEEKARRKKK